MFSSHVQQQRAGAAEPNLSDEDINTMRMVCTSMITHTIALPYTFHTHIHI
jgi:hypothetical protein